MTYTIKLYDLQTFEPHGYLKSYDPNVRGAGLPYPTGAVTTTWHAHEAMTFATQAEAMKFYRQTSETCPVRPDGRPNRPLTAYSIVIEKEEPC